MRSFIRRVALVVAGAVGVGIALPAAAPPLGAQETTAEFDWLHGESDRLHAPGAWQWGGGLLVPRSGFGSWFARVGFEEATGGLEVDVGRVGLDRILHIVRHRSYYRGAWAGSHPWRRRASDGPWWVGLGLFGEDGSGAPSSPDAGWHAAPDTGRIP
jgi:hypothetical protein